MDAVEQARRWVSAKEKLTAAQLCCDHHLYGESVACKLLCLLSGDVGRGGRSALGLWRHGGLINAFCRGRWATPTLLPPALATLRKKLDALYRWRIAVDYAAASASYAQAEFGLDVMQETLHLIAHHTGRAL